MTQEIGSEATPDDYVAALVTVFREVKRVLRDDGVVFLNLGDSFGGKQLLGIPFRVAFALQADGWILRSDIVWSKPNCMPESVKDRPTKAHEYVFLLSKQGRYFYDSDAIKEPAVNGEKYHGGQNDASVLSRTRHRNGRSDDGNRTATRNARSVWHIATTPFSSRNLADYVGDDGKPYIASEDCPVHSHLRGSRIGHTGGYDGRGVSGGSGTSRSGAGLALEPARVSAPIQDHAGDGQGYDRAATSGAGPLLDALAAIDHSTQSHRMGHALETSPACTPSAQTPGRTDGTQGEHAFDGQDLSTGESNTSGHFALDANPLGQTPGRIDGSDRLSLMPPDPNGSTAKCTCQVLQDHFAVMPPKLVEPCVLAGCPVGGVVLDPFCGAGTVGLVATQKGRRFIGIDLNARYLEIARRRIEKAAPVLPLLLTGD